MQNRNFPELTPVLCEQLSQHIAAKYKSNIRQTIKKMGVESDTNPITLIIALEKDNEELTQNTIAWITKETLSFLGKKIKKSAMKNIKVNIILHSKQDQNSIYYRKDPEQKSIDLVYANLKKLPNTAILLSSSPSKDYALLRKMFFEKILFNSSFRSHFPTEKIEATPKILHLFPLLTHMEETLLSINNQMTNAWDELVNKADLLLEFKIQVSNTTDAFTASFDSCIRDILFQSTSLGEKWDKMSCLLSLFEDALETTNDLLCQLDPLSTQLQALEQLHQQFLLGVNGLPINEQVLLLDTSEASEEMLAFLSKKEEHQRCLDKLKGMLSDNQKIYREHVSNTSLILLFKFKEPEPSLPEPKTTAAPAPNITSTSPSAPSPFVEDQAKSNPNPDSPQDTASTSYQHVTAEYKNVTAEYKKQAHAQIEKENAKKAAHRNRFLPPPDTDTQAEKSERTHTSDAQPVQDFQSEVLQLTLLHQKQTLTVSASQLTGTDHLYFSCEAGFLSDPKYSTFQATAENAKLLTRDSLGSGGIKIYGLNCLIVKSKQFPKEHLFCVAHPIPGTQQQVYLPYKIISHQKYNRLLQNKNELEIFSNKARETLEIKAVSIPVVLQNAKFAF